MLRTSCVDTGMHHRLVLVLLASLAACGSSPRPIQNASAKPARYSLQPLKIHGGQGRHSSSQSWMTYTGVLELSAHTATLELAIETYTTYIHCGVGMENSRQACAPRELTSTTNTHRIPLTGDARWMNGKLQIVMRKDDAALTLVCTEQGRTLECSYDDDRSLLGVGGWLGSRPSHMTFEQS